MPDKGENAREFLTIAIPAIAGVAKVEPSDFVVTEQLAYKPSGTGTHVFVEIEKVDLSTFDAVRQIAARCGRPEDEIGFAGLKDKRAITRQTLSVEHVEPSELDGFTGPGLRVLSVARHGNKIKRGHVRANRFGVRVRGIGSRDLEYARKTLAILEKRGLPNSYGEQRFGRFGTTPALGRALLAEDYEGFLREFAATCTNVSDSDARTLAPRELSAQIDDRLARPAFIAWASGIEPGRATRRLPRRFLSLCTSAVQAEVFNAVLRERLDEIDDVRVGDLAYLHRNGAVFAVEDLEAERPRVKAFEISASGPLLGPAATRPSGEVAELEDRVAQQFGVTAESFGLARSFGQKGGRRPLRVPLADARVREEEVDGEPSLWLEFELPAGSYATVVLRELFKRRQISSAPD